ncbi:pyridoxine 5'-phosphate synthase [bacterium]|nr:pyridoxine 5'-phosphate synthase [bacterium]
MAKLGVNLDHIATIREARKTNEPDPVFGAYIVELAGGHGVTIHLREDRRHIQDRDLDLMRQVVTKMKLNLEMAATPEMLKIAARVLPNQVTLVPEKRQEVTTEGGLDIMAQAKPIASAIKQLHKHAIEVSLFIDPVLPVIEQARALGADAIELHTGSYARAWSNHEYRTELDQIIQGTQLGRDLGLVVHAGHGLTYQNIKPIAAIPLIEEFNIGHSIIARAVYVGLERAIRDMLALIS